MNTIIVTKNLNVQQTLTNRCVQSCKKLLLGIESARNRIAHEFHETVEAHGQLVQLALNEAEALAWQTSYPQLFFPSLAVEKVQAVAAWQMRQQSLHQRYSVFAEAA
jgi:hypothetical protein